MTLARILTITALTVTLTASVAYAGGHEGNPAVKARKSHMALYAHNLGILGGMARGTVDYDAAAASAAAQNLNLLTQVDQSSYWVPGTSNADLGDETRLLPALFEDGGFARREEIFVAIGEAAANLAAVAGDGQAALGPALGPVGRQCGACHEAFQQSNN